MKVYGVLTMLLALCLLGQNIVLKHQLNVARHEIAVHQAKGGCQ